MRSYLVTFSAAAILVSVTSLPAAAAPGDAPSPRTARELCVGNYNPDRFTILHMPGGRGKVYPEDAATLRPGDVLRIEPDMGDLVDPDLNPGAAYTPDGTPAGVQPPIGPISAPSGYPAPGISAMSLFGFFGGFPPQPLGVPSSCIEVPVGSTNGKLTLAINDPATWDNSGAWDVTVKLYRPALQDGGFELQRSRGVSLPWVTEGPGIHGIDVGLGLANFGRNNAFIWTTGREWNAIVQNIPVRPNTNYLLSGFVRTSPNVNTAFFGARLPNVWPPTEIHFGPSRYGPTGGYQQLDQPFNSGNSTFVTVFAGFWGLGTESWIQLDDLGVSSS